MNKNKILKILSILKKEFPDLQVPLRHRNAFELLIAVILSAQCTDKRVNQVTLKLFPQNRACTPKDIISLGENSLKKIIYPCGYYNTKSKAIIGTTRALLGKEVPENFEDLIKLPGVGPKTAQVVQAQWFGKDAFPVDTHIHRVCNRIGLVNSGKNRRKTEKQIKTFIPKKYWSNLHLQLIYHGRKTCTAYKPKCKNCPLYDLCEWKDKKI